MRALLLVPLVLPGLLAGGVARGPSEVTVARGAHLIVVAHSELEGLAAEALAAAETAWSIATELFEVAGTRPRERYRIELFRARAAFDSACPRPTAAPGPGTPD